VLPLSGFPYLLGLMESEFGQIWVSRRNFIQDLTHRYLIYIDGNVVGELSCYRTARYEVPTGFHRVWAKRTNRNPAPVGDVVVNVLPGEVRRIRTTTRLKRVSYGRFLLSLLPFPRGDRFDLEYDPSVLLRAWPASDIDSGPPSALFATPAKTDGVEPQTPE
jgi:hypothetical protein